MTTNILRFDSLIGKDLDTASQKVAAFAGFSLRVVVNDGEPVLFAEDETLRTNRLNVFVREGRVVRILGIG